jgi:hypothetical protein
VSTFLQLSRVTFDLATTRELLANPPDPNFPIDYAPEVLDRIHVLTAGQPYLTQLIGFQLVRHYNQQAFDKGEIRDPIFTLEDLETVITDPTFFDRGRYYFTGVWGQAQQDVPHQQTILQALAPHPSGLSLAELSTTTHLDIPSLTAALKVLVRVASALQNRHDVAHAENDQWLITIELFRRWVVNRLYVPH